MSLKEGGGVDITPELQLMRRQIQNVLREMIELSLGDIASQLGLLNQILSGAPSRFAIDPQGRVRVLIDAAGTATPVTISSGTVTTVSTLSAITTSPYGQAWELRQRSNIEYNECQRSKMTFS